MQEYIPVTKRGTVFVSVAKRLATLSKLRTLRLILTFYKSFAFASWMITLSCISIAYTHGIRTITALFWFKIVTLGIVVYVINSYKREEFYYYKNLGFTKMFLWKSTLLFEMIVFIALLALTIKIR